MREEGRGVRNKVLGMSDEEREVSEQCWGNWEDGWGMSEKSWEVEGGGVMDVKKKGVRDDGWGSWVEGGGVKD